MFMFLKSAATLTGLLFAVYLSLKIEAFWLLLPRERLMNVTQDT